ncbi:MAG: cbb3-type cytochrome c oxidase subunit I [Ardenticatenia bacterium]|nr:cbb3-type cytochrome c oxidase subunit I [Ardenticatenia bacterium]
MTTALVAVPTGVKFFSWIATLWEGKISFEVPMLFVLGAFVVFLIGGLSGPPNAYYVADQPLHDTYWVVAHFHHTMFGGFIFPFIAAVYFWFPKATGKMFSKGWGQLQFWLIFIGFHMKTFPMFLIGLQGMRRRIGSFRSRASVPTTADHHHRGLPDRDLLPDLRLQHLDQRPQAPRRFRPIPGFALHRMVDQLRRRSTRTTRACPSWSANPTTMACPAPSMRSIRPPARAMTEPVRDSRREPHE